MTRASYNAISQRTSVADPNQGTWGFGYNALGELLQHTDARGISTGLAYDKLGRPTTRTATVEVTGDASADAVVDSWGAMSRATRWAQTPAANEPLTV